MNHGQQQQRHEQEHHQPTWPGAELSVEASQFTVRRSTGCRQRQPDAERSVAMFDTSFLGVRVRTRVAAPKGAAGVTPTTAAVVDEPTVTAAAREERPTPTARTPWTDREFLDEMLDQSRPVS